MKIFQLVFHTNFLWSCLHPGAFNLCDEHKFSWEACLLIVTTNRSFFLHFLRPFSISGASTLHASTCTYMHVDFKHQRGLIYWFEDLKFFIYWRRCIRHPLYRFQAFFFFESTLRATKIHMHFLHVGLPQLSTA